MQGFLPKRAPFLYKKKKKYIFLQACYRKKKAFSNADRFFM